ncbi:MAG: RsmF rRNA methyltransferase first C-terminal domain-containing protein, partial [Clostridiales bacterium]|nr:RsmF rRNA methyltransferase first C-terminal domain-containing protein [Clostridiales bacterium]
MLMPGGTLVYSTCTFSPEENEGTIGAFLEKHPEFTVVSEPNLTSDSVTYTVPDSATGQTAATSVRNDIYNPTYVNFFAPGHPEWGDGNPALQHTHRLWPHKLQGEGHFAAVLIKAGQLPHKSTKQRANGIINKNQASLLHEFLTSTLSEPMMHWIECGSLTLFGDQLYRLPEDAPSLDGLRVLRAGLHVGTFRKNRFEPSHALALAIGSEDVRQALSLSRGEEAAKYLRGESLYVSEITSRQAQISNGWVLICIGSFSAGWGKVTGDMVKNHYPKGLRKTNK